MATRLGWLEKEFRIPSIRILPGGLLLAAAYALLYPILRNLSVDQWFLPAGLRVAALLLFAPRYWPYLVLGEYAIFAYARFPHAAHYGWTYTIVASAALMPTVAFIVHRHQRLIASGNQNWILSVAALSAIAVTAVNLGTVWLFRSTPHEAVSWNGILKYILGDYLGILIFAPLVMLWKQSPLVSPSIRRIPLVALVSIAVMVMLGVIAMLIPIPPMDPTQPAQGPTPQELIQTSLRILMVVPAIALTYRYGWRGAAIGVVSMNLIAGLTIRSLGEAYSSDGNAFIVLQEILAVAGTGLLVFGSSISHYYRKFKHRDVAGRHAIAAARINLTAGERALFDRVIRMEIIANELDSALRNAIRKIRNGGLPGEAMALHDASIPQLQLFREQLLLTYPSGIGHYGLYVALHSSGFFASLEQTGRLTRPHLHGNPAHLSIELQVTAYRSICDAVQVLMEHETGTIDVRARCWRQGTYRGIAINIALLDRVKILAPATTVHAMDLLMGRALLFDGTVRCRRNRIRILLSEHVAGEPVGHRVPSGASTDQSMPPALS